jgi:hypothetical protein
MPLPEAESDVPEGIRERFLMRASSHGLLINVGEPFAGETTSSSKEVEVQTTGSKARPTSDVIGIPAGRRGTSLLWSNLLHDWGRVTLVASAFAACFLLGIMVRPHNDTPTVIAPSSSAVVNLRSPNAASIAMPDRDALQRAIRELTKERDGLAKQYAQLLNEQEAITKAKQDSELAFKTQTAALTADAVRDHEYLAQQTIALKDRALTLESQLAALQKKQTDTEMILSAPESATRQYFSQVGDLKQRLATESHVAPIDKNEVQSLVTARNLHIIDVYDSDGMGKRQHAFGRIFYVEGRSLVFYAYDLGKAHRDEKIAFHVWGTHDDKETIISLGVLHDQDPSEQRWVLAYDDPKVLSKINSVFVTIEPSNRDVTAPTGKKVLYAFLGAHPNHP